MGMQAAQFVPATAIEAEKGEVIGRGVEGHCGKQAGIELGERKQASFQAGVGRR